MADRKKFSIEDVAWKVHNEGLDYAIMHYMSADDVEDPELAKLWDEAEDILDKITRILDAAIEV